MKHKLCQNKECEREVRMKWCWEHQPKYNLPSPYKKTPKLLAFRKMLFDKREIIKVK